MSSFSPTSSFNSKKARGRRVKNVFFREKGGGRGGQFDPPLKKQPSKSPVLLGLRGLLIIVVFIL